MNKIYYRLRFMWAILGVTLILGCAIIRVSSFAVPALEQTLSAFEWTVLISWSIFMLFTEGYYGFQLKFSPRVVLRAQYMAEHGRNLDIILAPLFCMGYFRTTKRRLLSTYILTGAIILFIVVVSQLSQPWRGIIDFGVLLGLTYGLLWIYIYAIRALMNLGNINVIDPEVE